MCSRRITKKRMFSKNIIQFTSSYHAFTTSSVRIISPISSYLVISFNGQLFFKTRLQIIYFIVQRTFLWLIESVDMFFFYCYVTHLDFWLGISFVMYIHDILQHEKTKTVIQHFVRSHSNERNKNVPSTACTY